MNKKKIAAIMSAVNSYIKAGQECAAAPMLPTPPSIWGADGRRQMMSMRNLWQMRIIKKAG
ncbi:MAG: hypothetical protein NTV89_09160 [Proteobacteria bacterium]|nr:hypothetical protein [Pseudomonadota bacterium]